MKFREYSVLLLCAVLGIGIHSTSASCPSYCYCYKWYEHRLVDCKDKTLLSVPNDIPKYVQVLDLSSNVITSLENAQFQKLGYSEITTLFLGYNHIHDIQPRAFQGLQHLRKLDLSRNHIRYMVNDIFRDNTELEELDLSHNMLGENSVTLNIPSLQILNLESCRYDIIDPDFFSKLNNVKELILKNNNLIQLRTSTIEQLTQLTFLDISGNPIPCNEEGLELQNWLADKSVQHNFCLTDGEKSSKQIVKLEKIIQAPIEYYDESIETLSNIDNTWIEERTESKENCTDIGNNKPSSEWSRFYDIEIVPTVCALFVGINVGLIFGVWMGYCCFAKKRNRGSFDDWIDSWRVSLRRRSDRPTGVIGRASALRRGNSVYQPFHTPPGTPPPAYCSRNSLNDSYTQNV